MIPDTVRAAANKWRLAGSPPQEPMGWSRNTWLATLPEHAATIKGLPDLVDRRAVRAVCTAASLDPANAVAGFVAAMVWCFGNVGYGPFRTHRILTENRDASTRLQAAAQATVADGPLAGYRSLATSSRLKGLGPAFGTKFLYFVSKPGNGPALILDALMARWLKENAQLAFDPVAWHPPTYMRYLDAMRGWAHELDIAADDLELCLFSAQATAEGSAWGVGGQPASAPSTITGT